MAVVLKPIEALKDTIRKARAFRNTDDVKSYYTFKEKLGAGFFATVFRAVEKKTGTEVAIKVIDKSKVGEKVEMLEEEVGILGKVHHENCVSMIEIFETSRHVYLVMELVTGGELFTRICREKTFSEADAARIMGDLCSGLKYLHSLGIVHRDLKPENILLESPADDAKLKIADFGLSKIMRGKSGFLHSRCGTPAYAAPELIRGDPYDSKVDMWAAGCILYILLSGCPPFWGADTQELFERILSGYYPMDTPQFESVSNKAKLLIRRLLVLDPAARMSADDVLAHPWITGDRKKLEGRKLMSLNCMSQYVKKHKESIVHVTADDALKESLDLSASTDPSSSSASSISSSSSSSSSGISENIVGSEEAQTIFSAPLPAGLVERVQHKYPEWPDFKAEFEVGHVLGCPDIALIKRNLQVQSVWKERALESGYIRPFLILVSMHPRQRFAFARLLKIDYSNHLWFGEPHRESWEIISHPLEGIRPKTKGSNSSWWDTLTQVSDATLAHFWSNDKDSKKAVLNRPSLGKSEIRQALDNKDDPNLAIVEDIFADSVHNKLDKLRREESGGHLSLYEGPYNSVEEAPASLRTLADNLNSAVQNKSIVLKLVNWYGNEGFRKVPDNDKVFLAWVEKERHLNLSNVFLGKSRVRELFPVIFAICLQRLILDMFGISLKDYWPSS